MINIQEICEHLKSLSKALSADKQSIDCGFEEIDEKLKTFCENHSKVNEINEINETIDSMVNELKSMQTLDENSKLMLKSIELMLKTIVLLSDVNERDMISNQHFLTIKLSTIKLISMTIIPYISQHFQQIQHLFLSVESKGFTHFDQQFICRQFIHKLTLIFITLLNSKSIISEILIEDCFASLLASLMTVRHDSDCEEEKQSIDGQLSQLVSDFDHIVVIRNLLLLSRCKAIKWSNNEISRYLSRCLTTNSGLICLINAVLDCDQTSERETTLNQRFQAIGTIVSAIPQLCCSLRQYYESICGQVLDLMMSSNTNYQTIGSMIVFGLEKRSQKLTQELIIDKILDVFLKSNTSCLSIDNTIEIIHNLIGGRFDGKKFVSIVSHLFYCRAVLEESLSHYKTSLNVILVEIFGSVKQSVYLLDNSLYNNQKLMNSFEIVSTDSVIGLKFKQCLDPSLGSDSSDKQELSLKQIDSIIQTVIQLLSKLSESFKIDFFLLLIERMTFNEPSLMTCSLIDSLYETVSSKITNYSQKSIKFVVNTIERLAEQQSRSSGAEEDTEIDSDFGFNEMKQNSLTICLQIIKVLTKERNKLLDKDIIELKRLIPSLDRLSRNESIDESLRKSVNGLKIEINLMENNLKFCSMDRELQNDFESAMTELNDHLMPVRAHALIRLKQLIYAKDSHLLQNKRQLINALKMCLNDSESYIYLSSVNTLSTLAILCTEDVLPVLVQEFNDSERTVEERLKVGEVLVRLSKSIGDFAHFYSKQYINCFLIGVKSSEPAVRISSLSNLGHFCGALKFGLKPYIVELMSCVEAVLKTDDSIEVKRSSVMFLHLMLRGIERNGIQVIDQQLKHIYKSLRAIYLTTIDDVLQLHTQLAIEEIDRLARDVLKADNSLIKNIKVFTL